MLQSRGSLDGEPQASFATPYTTTESHLFSFWSLPSSEWPRKAPNVYKQKNKRSNIVITESHSLQRRHMVLGMPSTSTICQVTCAVLARRWRVATNGMECNLAKWARYHVANQPTELRQWNMSANLMLTRCTQPRRKEILEGAVCDQNWSKNSQPNMWSC